MVAHPQGEAVMADESARTGVVGFVSSDSLVDELCLRYT